MPVAVALSGHAGWRTGALKANIENCRPSPIEVFEFHFWNSESRMRRVEAVPVFGSPINQTFTIQRHDRTRFRFCV
jgi:hypothetical protein